MEYEEREAIAKKLNMHSGLKPCPLCGGEAKFELWQYGDLVVRCTQCGCMTTPALVAHPVEYQRSKWNRRMPLEQKGA